MLAAVRIRKRRFKGMRRVRQVHYKHLKSKRLVRRVVRAQSYVNFICSSYVLCNILRSCHDVNFEKVREDEFVNEFLFMKIVMEKIWKMDIKV